jgi:hypothetical protein
LRPSPDIRRIRAEEIKYELQNFGQRKRRKMEASRCGEVNLCADGKMSNIETMTWE